MGTFSAPSVRVDAAEAKGKIELVFRGVEQAGPSFEARVFLNNTEANENTAQTVDAGYAGSFHVYGYGSPLPPAMAEAKSKRARGDEPIAPIEKDLEVNPETFHRAIARSVDLTVTVVTIAADAGDPVSDRPFEGVDVVFGRSAAGP
jgi:hypothetical protein